jgi:hypothetical protein
VLKTLMASAAILAFTPRKQAVNALVIDKAGAIDLAPMPTPIDPRRASGDTGGAWPEMTPLEAAKVFFLEMQAHAAGDRLQWRWLRHSYDVLALQRGWPALSDKALGMHMVSFGCKKKTVDLRRKGQGRTSAYEFPQETAATRRRRKK